MNATIRSRARSMDMTFAVFLLVGATSAAAAPPVKAPVAQITALQELVQGRVLDSAGNAIPNAVVSLAELRVATTTGNDGAFGFAGVPAGRYTLVARRVGFAAAVREIVVAAGATELTIRLRETPFQVEPVTVTATRLPTSTLRSPLPTSALGEDQLRREQSISLAKSLSKLPGVRSVSTGEQIGKPMIRGLFGSRVLVLENGSRLEDYSWSDEDAPSVDARLAQRVELIRGPASVLYGSDAVGGVVNVVPEDLPSANGGRSFRQIGVEAYGATNNKELGSAIKIIGASGRLGWRLFGVGRFAESYSTPDGEVENTGFLAANGEAAAGIRGTRSNTSVRFSHYGGEFKLLEAGGPPPGTVEGTEEGPERKLSDDRVQLVSDYLLGGLRLETKAQWQRHALQEVSDDACRLFPTIPDCVNVPGASNASAAQQEQPAFDLLLNTGTLDVLGHHAIGDRVRGTIGLSGLYQKNDSRGPIFLVPDATVTSGGAFVFEEVTSGLWSLLAGGRVDSRHLDADANEALDMPVDKTRSWTVTSGNVGAVFRPLPTMALAGNFGAAWRAPTLFELYSNGPLLAESRFEIGDPSLKSERALNLDLSARWEGTRVRGEIAGFRNDIRDFVYLAPTAELNQGLRVFRHRQADALLTGGEISAEVEIARPLTIRARHDFVRGTNDDTSEPLPLMAPARTAAGVDFRTTPRWAASFFAGGEVEHVAKQTRPNPDDYVTGAYTLVNFDVGMERNFLGRAARVEVGVRNAGDVRYRSFLSRYKEFALEPGRNIIIRISTDR
jgi:iron complex outermembrane recepter protein